MGRVQGGVTSVQWTTSQEVKREGLPLWVRGLGPLGWGQRSRVHPFVTDRGWHSATYNTPEVSTQELEAAGGASWIDRSGVRGVWPLGPLE